MENKMMLVSRYVRLLALKSKAKPACTIQNEKGRADGNLRQPYPTASWYIWKRHAQSRHLSLFANLKREAFVVFDEREDGRSHSMTHQLRWPELIYMRFGYVLKSSFSAGKIRPISLIFGILNKEWSNFKKLLFIFL